MGLIRMALTEVVIPQPPQPVAWIERSGRSRPSMVFAALAHPVQRNPGIGAGGWKFPLHSAVLHAGHVLRIPWPSAVFLGKGVFKIGANRV
jgi:hypothetical protein